jgi:tellurite resistance protein
MKPSPLLQPAVQALCDHFPSSAAGVATAIDLAVLVAAADGQIDPAEMAALTVSLETTTQAHLAPAIVRHLVHESRNQIETVGAQARAKAIGETIAARGCVEQGLRVALLIALASDGLSSVERQQIDIVAKAAGASPDRVDAIRREIQASASA